MLDSRTYPRYIPIGHLPRDYRLYFACTYPLLEIDFSLALDLASGRYNKGVLGQANGVPHQRVDSFATRSDPARFAGRSLARAIGRINCPIVVENRPSARCEWQAVNG